MLQVGTLCQVDPLSILVDGGGTNRVASWEFRMSYTSTFRNLPRDLDVAVTDETPVSRSVCENIQ
jgi:hypothetical protein